MMDRKLMYGLFSFVFGVGLAVETLITPGHQFFGSLGSGLLMGIGIRLIIDRDD